MTAQSIPAFRKIEMHSLIAPLTLSTHQDYICTKDGKTPFVCHQRRKDVFSSTKKNRNPVRGAHIAKIGHRYTLFQECSEISSQKSGELAEAKTRRRPEPITYGMGNALGCCEAKKVIPHDFVYPETIWHRFSYGKLIAVWLWRCMHEC